MAILLVMLSKLDFLCFILNIGKARQASPFTSPYPTSFYVLLHHWTKSILTFDMHIDMETWYKHLSSICKGWPIPCYYADPFLKGFFFFFIDVERQNAYIFIIWIMEHSAKWILVDVDKQLLLSLCWFLAKFSCAPFLLLQRDKMHT